MSPFTSLPLDTLVDDPTTLPEPRPPLLKRMCAWCDLVLGWKVCTPENAGGITHGMCVVCLDKQAEELAQLDAVPLSDVRRAVPTASQAATPCVSASGYGAVNANARGREDLAAGVGLTIPLGGDPRDPVSRSLTCETRKATGTSWAARGGLL